MATSSPQDVRLRQVMAEDLPILFAQQQDPEAIRMAAFPPRDHDAFMEHWARLMAHETDTVRTILFGGNVAGYISSWKKGSRQLVAYWIGREFWGKGITTRALNAFLALVTTRPLYAHVAIHNIASIRVLEKCGFTIASDETRNPVASDGVEEVVMKLCAGQ